MRKIILLCCAFVPLTLLAQSTAKAVKVANPVPYANSITPDDLKKHLYIVAGKEMVCCSIVSSLLRAYTSTVALAGLPAER